MIYAGTGHRPDKLGGYGNIAMERVFNCIMENIPKDCTEIISGMALGFDTQLAKAAIAKKIPFIAAVPFYGQESKWPSYAQKEYRDILRKAQRVVMVCPGGYSPSKMQVRNEYMVDSADKVLALWNGTPGGTANCLTYALSKNKPVLNIWDTFQR